MHVSWDCQLRRAGLLTWPMTQEWGVPLPQTQCVALGQVLYIYSDQQIGIQVESFLVRLSSVSTISAPTVQLRAWCLGLKLKTRGMFHPTSFIVLSQECNLVSLLSSKKAPPVWIVCTVLADKQFSGVGHSTQVVLTIGEQHYRTMKPVLWLKTLGIHPYALFCVLCFSRRPLGVSFWS